VLLKVTAFKTDLKKAKTLLEAIIAGLSCLEYFKKYMNSKTGFSISPKYAIG
jgi:hypothetical protein